MRVERLTAVNVKRIEEIDIAIAKDAHLIIVGGNNGQGKTSTLDCIEYAIAGKRSIPDRPIREGEEYAEILLDVGEWTVKRTWRSNKDSVIKVENKDGSIVKGPQTWLDATFGPLSFDPFAFARMDAKKQFETLRDLVGLDLGPLEGERQRVYEDRTETNRYLKHAQGQLEGFPLGLSSAPDEPVTISELMSRASEIRVTQEGIDYRSREIAKIHEWIEATEAKLREAREKAAQLETERDELAGKIVDLPTLEEITAQIDGAEKTNERVRLKKEREAVKAAIVGYQADEKRMTKKLAEIDARKREAIAAAPFPIEGLALEDGRVIYNGVPFDQAAESQKLRVSVAIGLAMNPKLKLLLIRDGALLDLESLKEVEAMAIEHDAQIIIERVGKQGPVTYVIEDGRVLEGVTQ